MPARPPTSNGPATLAARDPSQSKTYLTRSNHHGPSLLKTVNGRARYPLLPADAPNQKSDSAEHAMTEGDINAPPRDSSDEEGEDDASDTSTNSKLEPSIKTAETSPPPSRRPNGGLQDPRRSKRPRLHDEPDPPQDLPQEKPERNTCAGSSAQSSEGNMFDLMHAPRASQKKFKSFGKQVSIGPKREAPPFKAPNAMLDEPTEIDQPSAAKALIQKRPEEVPAESRKAFKAYAVPRHDQLPSGSGQSSQDASLSNSFNRSGQSERPERTASSPPSTPTSQRRDCEMPDSPATNMKTNICPVCQKEVVRSRLNDPDTNIREVYFFPLRKQQAFCHEHTLADARVLFDERKFPEINWFRLKTQRIPRHNKLLKDIICRRIPSHFLDEVDAQIPDKTNRKQIQKFLERQRKEATLSPTGYYGAKGAQIMAEVIAQELSSFLSGRAAHEVIKFIGVGPFIASVLIPELTQRLVMEDMNLGDASKARTIMHESAYAGMILHPEDEKVERQEDD